MIGIGLWVLACVALVPAVALLFVIADRGRAIVPGDGLDFTDLDGKHDDAPLVQIAEQRVRVYPGPAEVPVLILIHGSGWYGQQMHALATAVAANGWAEVLVPDLRGHGMAPQRRGDVDYIGQLEDDLAALIAAHVPKGRRVVMAGHSSGGGLVVRFAGGAHGKLMSGACLIAPFLGHRAPSSRKNSGGWAVVQVRRILGLSILNGLGVRMLNHLTVIRFRMPQAVIDGPLGQAATLAYSYRLNTSYAPRRAWAKDLAALPSWRLIAGEQDEAMDAATYQDVMRGVPSIGRVEVVPGVGHIAIVDRPEVKRALQELLL